MSRPIGRFVWVIPEGYIPSESHGPQPAMTSHETACLLNAGDTPAHVRITIFYADREPIRPYEVVVLSDHGQSLGAPWAGKLDGVLRGSESVGETGDSRGIMLDAGYVSARSKVEAPCPQPTSATCAPALSLASTPSSAGIHALARLLR